MQPRIIRASPHNALKAEDTPIDHPKSTGSTDAEALDSSTRDSSVWPDTEQHPRHGAHAPLALSHFDPLYAQKTQDSQRLSTQFDLCRPALGLRVLLFVQAVVVLAGLPLARGWMDMGLNSIALGFGALASGLVWLPAVCALRPALAGQGRVIRELAVALLGGVSALVGWGMLVMFGLVSGAVPTGLGVAAGGVALAVVVWRWLALRAAAAQPVEASARLVELQSRIRPHFLFNALNTALALVQVDPQRAEVVLEDLAQLFRVALAETGAAVTLDDEIDLAQRYLAIEQLRFGPRMEVHWHLDPAAAHAPVPPLVLQPLVENAVRHGVEPSVTGARIVISSSVHRGMAEVVVTNTLSGERGRPGAGIALANVAERLRLLHDVAASLECEVRDGMYWARIQVPL